MLLVVMIDGPGINGQMISFDVQQPETPIPLNGPIQFKKILKNVGNAYSDGNHTFNFPSLQNVHFFVNFKLSFHVPIVLIHLFP